MVFFFFLTSARTRGNSSESTNLLKSLFLRSNSQQFQFAREQRPFEEWYCLTDRPYAGIQTQLSFEPSPNRTSGDPDASPARDRQHPHRERPTLGLTTPLGHRIITETGRGDRSKRRRKLDTDVQCSLAVPVPSVRVHRPHSGGTEPTCPMQRGGRSADGRAPLRSPPSAGGRGSGNPAPAAPRPLRGPASRPFPARGPRALRGGRRTPSPDPRRLNLQRTAGSEARSPSAGPARRPRLLTVGAKALRGARGGSRGAPHSPRDLTPCSEPTEPRRLCLQGLSPARTLDKHFRGSGGGQGFGTGTAPRLELPALPGGAWPLLRAPADPPPSPAPGLLANPCGPAGPELPLAPLILTPVRIAPFYLILQGPGESNFAEPGAFTGLPTGRRCYPFSLLSRVKMQLTFIEGRLTAW